jgi:Asp-tRNA(Asn)/Glu-tRNA(Gln) amidotransferase A subunit family amidase
VFPRVNRQMAGLFESHDVMLSPVPLQNASGVPVPLHWTADDLPVGVQFSSWRGGDRILLELPYELEEARPWANRRPPVDAMR